MDDPSDPIPDEFAAQVAALHLADLADLAARSKGKGKEGELSDEQLAFQLYRGELEASEQVLGDLRLALSMERAVGADRVVLEQMEREETMARRDRELARSLDQHAEDSDQDRESMLSSPQTSAFTGIPSPSTRPASSLPACSSSLSITSITDDLDIIQLLCIQLEGKLLVVEVAGFSFSLVLRIELGKVGKV
ncbi:hypothetical protein JCM11641_005196 [Rhodosporidiobolus odoratus]